MANRSLVTIENLTNEEIEEIFSLADGMGNLARGGAKGSDLNGKIMATLFYEPSTRTRLSFESAMLRLGGSVVSCPDMRSSSAAKGESIADTARVLSSYADILVVRHYWDGAAQSMAEYAEVPVINAGDGSHEHPTQTLCDLYTLRKEKGRLKGLTVAICGDLKHGRTIHSLVYALARFGVNVITLAARGLELPQYAMERLETEFHYGLTPVSADELHRVVKATDAVYLTPSQPHQLALFTQLDGDVEKRLANLASEVKLDAFYVTRKQTERMKDSGDETARSYPKIGEAFFKEKRFRDTLVMHPLPRVDEISYAMDKDRRGIYFKQAAYGVPVRMALLKFLFDSSRAGHSQATTRALIYRTPDSLPAQCSNSNCVSRNEPASTQPRFEVVSARPSSRLVLRCFYCAHQLRIQFVGHTTSKRYCAYDLALADTLGEWLKHGELVIFDSIKQAEELGYGPYKVGPQRNVMDEEEIQRAIREISTQILKETEDLDDLVVLGIRTKGAFVAQRIAHELESQCGRKVPLGEIEVYGSQEGIRVLAPTELEPHVFTVKDHAVVLVDDVIHTGATVNSALSIIFKSGRPRSVRLAVLVDRGHRELPVRANYVGKHIPSSEKERVRVKLREIDQDERDKVIVHSIIGPAAAEQENAKA